jgi:hypothetical protein
MRGSFVRRLSLVLLIMAVLPLGAVVGSTRPKVGTTISITSAYAGDNDNVRGTIRSKLPECLAGRTVNLYRLYEYTPVATVVPDGEGAWVASARLREGDDVRAIVQKAIVDVRGTDTVCKKDVTDRASTVRLGTLHSLDIARDGNGQGTWTCDGAPCHDRYLAGAQIAVTPIPDQGSAFEGWSGDCEGSGACVVAMDGDRSVTATFGLVAHELTLAPAQGGGGGTIVCGFETCSHEWLHGRTVAARALADGSSRFESWFAGPCAGQTVSTCTFQITSDTTLGARFVPRPPTEWQPPEDRVPTEGSFFYFESDVGEWVGRGGAPLFTLADSEITASASERRISLRVDGDSSWNGSFELPAPFSEPAVGLFEDAERYPFNADSVPGLSFTGEGRGCNTVAGWFAVDEIGYDGDSLDHVTLRFEQHCEAGSKALRGKLRFDNDETPVYPDPGPPPSWQPAAGTVPATGSFFHYASEPFDFIGQGQSATYVPASAVFTVIEASGRVSLKVTNDDERLDVTIKLPDRYAHAEAGHFPGVQRYPFHNPVKGGLSATKDGRGCNTVTGWFVIDEIGYEPDGTLDHVTFRFEQHCSGRDAALRGKLRFDNDG